MTFVLRMVWRETRSSWGRLAFFFVCVAIGVAAIVILRSVVQNVRLTLTREAREIVGGDIVVQSLRPWTDETRGVLGRVLEGVSVERTDVIETRTMASPVEGQGNGRVRLVELRGVEPAFPLYGAIDLDAGLTYSYELLRDYGALVTPEFLLEMGLRVGDPVRLGGRTFTIRGEVLRDRIQRGGGTFAFGPRVYVALDDLRALGLLGFGSSGTYMTFLRVPRDGIPWLVNRLRREYAPYTVSVRSWLTYEDRLGENLSTAENYLSLVGFVIVVIGGIGVWSVTRVLVQQKVRSVAILKCVGATSRQVLATYVAQVLGLAAAGSALGIALAVIALKAIPESVLQPLGIASASVTLSAAVQGALVGVLVSLLFALVPLLEMRRIKPLLLLRADSAGSARSGDLVSRLAAVATVVALVLVAVWQAGSVQAGLFVSGGLVGVGLLLILSSRVLVWATAPLTRSPAFALRHALISLRRPGNQTRVILTAVGLGSFFVLGVRAIQTNLVDEFNAQLGATSPDLVLLDVQQDQIDDLSRAVGPYLTEPPRLMPLMRARVTAIIGRNVNLPTPDAVRRHGRMTREFGVTFRDHVQPNERVLDGQFWTSAATGPPDVLTETEVSISEEVREQTGAAVGDLIRLDIAGQTVALRVTSVRRVQWDETQNGGFFFVLRPGPAMARLPHTYVGFLRTRDDAEARAALQRDLVRDFRNVSAIDVRAVVASIRSVIDNVTLGITVVGGITVACGVLILVGAVAMTRFQRMYEAAVYRTLGASTRVLTSMVAVEYGVLGLLAGVLGAAGALALSWALMTFLFDMRWHAPVALVAVGAVATAAGVCLIGLAASVDVVLRKPLATLRQ